MLFVNADRPAASAARTVGVLDIDGGRLVAAAIVPVT
jgi:hypothetical protein